MSASSTVRRVVTWVGLRGPLADDATAQTLHQLLVVIALWVGFAAWPLLFTRKLPNVTITVAIELTMAIALYLLRRGFLRQSATVYLSGMWLIFAAAAIFNAGIRSPGLIIFAAIPISAAWLLGYHATLWTTAASIGYVFALAILESAGVKAYGVFVPTPWSMMSTLTLSMLIAAVPVARVLRTLQAALAELLRHREHLQELVDQRTQELVKARDEAEAANRAKTLFLASMSHELRTPLNAILGFSALVRDHPDLREDHRKHLNVVNRSGAHLLGLIDDVLDMAKIESGRATVEMRDFDLIELVRENIDMMRLRAADRGIELILKYAPTTPRLILSDAGKIRQILINLMGNAVKFTERGSVTVRLSGKASAAGDGEVRLLLEVEDTGIGIAPEDKAHIFDLFVQARNISTQKGTGLGLSITQQFVQLMGGTIAVESTPGKGSRFRVELPVVEQLMRSEMASATECREVIGLASGQPSYRILIVEDRKENSLLLQKLLLDAGFQVEVAEDGAQGVEKFRTWQPDLIWMDIRLPVMGGVEATEKIRGLEERRSVKIVALSASVLADEREAVLAVGMDDFLRKPYRRQEIFDVMARHLDVRYVYQEAEHALATKPSQEYGWNPALLPSQLRRDLKDAVITLDAATICEVIDRVTQYDAELGEILDGKAKRLRYSEILNALE